MTSVATIFFFFVLLICEGKADNQERWRCDNGEMISYRFRCDGWTDCTDSSDESAEHCPPRDCFDDEFQCSKGGCVSYGLVCSGSSDCPMEGDDSDETDDSCGKYFEETQELCDSITSMKCTDGSCILLEYRCDQENDCPDGEDEAGCQCKINQFSCGDVGNQLQCIAEKWVCDGERDCANGNDEMNCTLPTVTTTTAATDCDVDEFACPYGKCIAVEKACDGNYDCSGGEDEGHCHVTSCRTRSNPLSWYMVDVKHVCDQGCRQTPVGPKCFCFFGYRLEPDGTRCRLEGDGVPKLLFAADNQIRELELTYPAPSDRILFTDYDNKNARITGLDGDVSSNLLLWADHHSGKIHIRQSKKHHMTWKTVNWASALAYDWITHNIYVTYTARAGGHSAVGVISVGMDAYGSEEVMSHEFATIRVSRPMSIAIVPSKRKLVIADSGDSVTPSSLIMAGMDGSEVSTIATAHETAIHCVTVDYVTDIVYWSESNSRTAKIEMIHLESLKRKTLISSDDGEFSFSSPFSLSVFETSLYFSDNQTREIWRIDSLNGKPKGFGNYTSSPILKLRHIPNLLAIHVSHAVLRQRPSQANDCTRADCSHICVLVSTGSRCFCPTGLVLSGNTCFEITEAPGTSSESSPSDGRAMSTLNPVLASTKTLSNPSTTTSTRQLTTTKMNPTGARHPKTYAMTTTATTRASSKTTAHSTTTKLTPTRISFTELPQTTSTMQSLTVSSQTTTTKKSSVLSPQTTTTKKSSVLSPQTTTTKPSSVLSPQTTTTKTSSVLFPRTTTTKTSSVLFPRTTTTIKSSIVFPQTTTTRKSLTIQLQTTTAKAPTNPPTPNLEFITTNSTSVPLKLFNATNTEEIFDQRCPRPPTVAGSALQSAFIDSGEYMVGFTISYSCEEGLHFEGDKTNNSFTITCMKGGKWNRAVPKCVGYSCEDLQCGDHGKCKLLPSVGAICQCVDGSLSFKSCESTNETTNTENQGLNPSATHGGKLAAIVLTLLALIAFCGFLLWMCLRKNDYSLMKSNGDEEPVCSHRSIPCTSTPLKMNDKQHETSLFKNERKGFSNPNSTFSGKTKIRLPSPDNIDTDSGVDQLSSSVSSGDSPGVYNYSHLKATSDADLCNDVDRSLQELTGKKIFRDIPSQNQPTDVRSAISSIFNLRKSESQECMLPPV